MTGQIPALRVLPKQLFRRLDTLKQNNLHGEAYQEAARALEHEELEQKFKQINIAHGRVGYLTPSLYEARHRAYDQLMKHARTQLSPKQYNRLYMCF